MLFSASSTIAFNKFGNSAFYIKRHLIRIIIGMLAFAFAYKLNFKIFKHNAKKIIISFMVCYAMCIFF